MVTKNAPATVDTLVVLGAGGDLTARLLLPGLASFLASDKGRPINLVGSDLPAMTQRQWTARVRKSFGDLAGKPAAKAVLRDTSYIQCDVTDPGSLAHLCEQVQGTPAIFFALPPAITEKAAKALKSVTLPPKTVLLMEKPFGTDAASAGRLNTVLTNLVPEEQIHRVDHFLAKSTVLNILGLRFANRLFERNWSNADIDRIDIVFDEDLTLEGRAGYYDHAGALRDMIQSHLLQVMAFLTMDAPTTLSAEDLRDCKAQILRATRIWRDDPVASSRRARYSAGKVGRRAVPSYVKEPGVDSRRQTETLAELTVEIRNWRWAGVPIVLRSGKSLGNARKEAVVHFKPVPHLPKGLRGSDRPDVLRIGFGPDNLTLQIDVNGPGDPYELQRADLTAEFGPGEMTAYGEVLGTAFAADPTMSVRGDSAVDCWRIVDPVLNAWAAGKVPLQSYAAGSGGPKSWVSYESD